MIIYWTSLYYAFHVLKTVQEYVADSQKNNHESKRRST